MLFDVDNTLLDNDRIAVDLTQHLDEEIGTKGEQQYWVIFEELRAKLGTVEKEKADFENGAPKCIVSISDTNKRVVRILPRGNWMDESGEVVKAALPGYLPKPKIEGRDLTRLDLAQWLVSKDNPLTARTVMNRLWKQFFGTGLSKVLDDLGASAPTEWGVAQLLAIVDAQRDYASLDPMKTGSPVYARRLLSLPGRKDGLFWETKPGEPPSPLGPAVAKAQVDGASPDGHYGYYFRLLYSQGAAAPGGAHDYIVKDHIARLAPSVARELQAENASLRGLLNFQTGPKVSFVTASVVADASSSFVRSLIVLGGTKAGVAKGQAAMTGAGLAGRVLEVGERSARILLITDINARVPVVAERSRDQAVLAGRNSDLPELLYLSRDNDVKVGDRIVTSGQGGVFPAGLPVGEVTSVTGGHIQVQPFVDFSRLENIRLIDYSLPGILMQDLGVDTTKALSPNKQTGLLSPEAGE